MTRRIFLIIVYSILAQHSIFCRVFFSRFIYFLNHNRRRISNNSDVPPSDVNTTSAVSSTSSVSSRQTTIKTTRHIMMSITMLRLGYDVNNNQQLRVQYNIVPYFYYWSVFCVLPLPAYIYQIYASYFNHYNIHFTF